MGGEWLGSFMQATRDAEDSYYKAMQMRQMQEYAPLMQKLQQMELEQAQANIDLSRQKGATEQQRQDLYGMQIQEFRSKSNEEKVMQASKIAEQVLLFDDPVLQASMYEGARKLLGLEEFLPEGQIDQQSLMNVIASANALTPSMIPQDKVGRYKSSVIGDLLVTTDSVSGEVTERRFGDKSMSKPEGMSPADFELFKELPKKEQIKVTTNYLDPNKKAKTQEEIRKIESANEFQNKALTLIRRIKSQERLFPDVTGAIEGRFDFRVDTKEADLISDLNELREVLTSDAMPLMTGILTDKDMDVLRTVAAGGLVRTGSAGRLKTRIDELEGAFTGKLSETRRKQSEYLPNEFTQDIDSDLKNELETLRREVGL